MKQESTSDQMSCGKFWAFVSSFEMSSKNRCLKLLYNFKLHLSFCFSICCSKVKTLRDSHLICNCHFQFDGNALKNKVSSYFCPWLVGKSILCSKAQASWTKIKKYYSFTIPILIPKTEILLQGLNINKKWNMLIANSWAKLTHIQSFVCKISFFSSSFVWNSNILFHSS